MWSGVRISPGAPSDLSQRHKDRPTVFYPTAEDAEWMRQALAEAANAARAGEVPVGAVVVLKGQIIGRGRNLREAHADPTAHAEILALREAGRSVGGWNLTGAALYVTVEPCLMCAGAAWMARLSRVVYGAPEPKMGAVHSQYEVLSDARLGRHVPVVGGCLAAEARALLDAFFQEHRAGRRDARVAESGGLENR